MSVSRRQSNQFPRGIGGQSIRVVQNPHTERNKSALNQVDHCLEPIPELYRSNMLRQNKSCEPQVSADKYRQPFLGLLTSALGPLTSGFLFFPKEHREERRVY